LADILAPDLADRLAALPEPHGLKGGGGGGSLRADSLLNELTSLGGSYDKGASARPNPNILLLSRQELEVLIVCNHWARRAILQLPGDATRRGWTITDDSQEQSPLADAERQLKIRSRIAEADASARFAGRSAILLITAEKGELRAVLKTPIPEGYAGGLRNLVVLDDLEFSAYTWDGEPTSPTYREPLSWLASPASQATRDLLGGAVEVHASRMLVFSGSWLPSLTLRSRSWRSVSVLQPAWDAIRNKTSVAQSGAVIAQELTEGVLTLEGMTEAATGPGASTVGARVKAMLRAKGVLGLLILGANDKYEVKARGATGYVDVDEGTARDLAAALDMPVTLLFGDAPAGFNTDGDSWRRRWSGQVLAYQERIYRDPLERIYTLLLAALPEPPEAWTLAFLPIDPMTAPEEAALRKTVADTDAIYLNLGVLSPEHVARSRFGPDGWNAETLPVEEPGDGEAEARLAAEALAGSATPTEAPGAPAEKASDVALNGAQISSALSICQQVAARQLPRESGVTMLVEFFSLALPRAERIMGPIGKSFFIDPEVVMGAPGRTDADVFSGLLARLRAEGFRWDASAVRVARQATTLDAAHRRVETALARRRDALAARVRLDAQAGRGVTLVLPLSGDTLARWTLALSLAQAVLPDLPAVPDPHITLLHLGKGMTPEGLINATKAAREAVRQFGPVEVWPTRLHAFEPGEDGVPVILEVGGWALEALNVALLRALAPWVTAAQYPTFVAHATLGYLPRALTDTERADLAALTLSSGEGPSPRLARVEVWSGGVTIAELPLAGVEV
jgi:hypothetical protein